MSFYDNAEVINEQKAYFQLVKSSLQNSLFPKKVLIANLKSVL